MKGRIKHFGTGNHCSNELVQECREMWRPRVDQYLKRAMDVIGASVLLVLLAPFLVAVMMLLVAMDGGPIFHVHQRVGRKGKPFRCLKFRTMIMDADECLAEFMRYHPAVRIDQLLVDPRITPIGRYLRRTRLDRVPQILNVIRGQMSLVGPRVVSSEMSIRPGVTGLWRVRDVNESDALYMEHHTVAGDMIILSQALRRTMVRIRG